MPVAIYGQKEKKDVATPFFIFIKRGNLCLKYNLETFIEPLRNKLFAEKNINRP